MMKDGNPRHFYWIDWIRFLAALMVVIGHTRFQHFPYYDELLIPGKGKWSEFLFLIPRFANEAVTVFFVLSGFLVGGRCLERILTDRFDLGQYFVDRFTRILLPLVPVVLLTWMVTWIRGEPISVVEGLGNIASVQGVFVKPMTNNTSLWSLSYEVWFYVAAGAVALVVTGSSLRGKVWGLILAFTSMAIFTRLEASYFFIWMLGALAYFIGRDPGRIVMLLSGGMLALLGAVSAALGTEVNSLDIGWISGLIPPRLLSLMLLGFGVSLALPPLVVFAPVGRIGKMAESCGSMLAASSYSLYLIHRPVLKLWGHMGGDQAYTRFDAWSLTMFALKIMSCLLAGWLFYLLFEKQTVHVRRMLMRRNPVTPPAECRL